MFPVDAHAAQAQELADEGQGESLRIVVLRTDRRADPPGRRDEFNRIPAWADDPLALAPAVSVHSRAIPSDAARLDHVGSSSPTAVLMPG